MAGNSAVTPQSSRPRCSNKQTASSVHQFLHLAHRTGILAATIAYFVITMQATASMTRLLRSTELPTTIGAYEVQYLMETYIGSTTIRQSPLVTVGLQNNTTPRIGTMFLDAAGPSFSPCTSISPLVRSIYADQFMRNLFAEVVHGARYNLTFLAEEELELVVPVVDCLYTGVLKGYKTIGKYNFLVRKTRDPDDVYLATLLLASQEYRIEAQSERGSTAMVSLSLINNMRATSVTQHYLMSLGFPYVDFNFRVYNLRNVTPENWWCLESIPDPASSEIPKIVTAAFRTGFFMKSATEQINVHNIVKVISATPTDEITRWANASKPVLNDPWGWVHCVQLVLGLDLLMNLIVLLLVMFRNLQAREVWIGDAFVSISTKFVLQTSDYWSIVLITVLRWQFTRVYVYEIAGSTVQQTAKLVYPSTFTLTDLMNLNISVLS